MESHSSCVSITIEPINEPTPAGVSGRFKQQIHLDDTVRFDCPSNEEAHNFAARFPIASARSRFYEWEGEECCTQRRNCSILLLSLLFPIGEKSDRRKKKKGRNEPRNIWRREEIKFPEPLPDFCANFSFRNSIKSPR